MASYVMALPSLVMTTSMTNTSTATTPYVDISDAIALSGYVDGATTAPGFQIQVSFSTDGNSTSFQPLMQIYPLTTAAGNGVGGSTGVIPIYLSSFTFTVPDIVGKLARFGTSAAHTTTMATLIWAKRVEV